MGRAAAGGKGLLLSDEARVRLWQEMTARLESYLQGVAQERVAPELDPGMIRRSLAAWDFSAARSPEEVLDFAVEGLRRFQVHTSHPRYYGLFNPAVGAMGIAADTLVAAFNPQLAAWSHSPFAAELEQHLVRALGIRFGYREGHLGGSFASGGAEANHSALLMALARAFPEALRRGLHSLRAAPVFYISAQGHHSFHKAARLSGLGEGAVREIPVDRDLRMSVPALVEEIARDRQRGHAPFLVVATMGTTGAGAIDPVPVLSEVASAEGLWLHADAAWGGAAALVPELEDLLEGIASADSITFDAHKWLSVPMGAGLFLTRHPQMLARTFGVQTGYMPKEADHLDVADPFAHSMQWSRRFIGLKVFLTLAVAGWEGYGEVLRHQTAMGELLRQLLRREGWRIVNRTPLPLVCFVDDTVGEGAQGPFLDAVAQDLVASGRAWISTTALGPKGPALRACITSFRTGPDDIEALVEDLGQARLRQRS